MVLTIASEHSVVARALHKQGIVLHDRLEVDKKVGVFWGQGDGYLSREGIKGRKLGELEKKVVKLFSRVQRVVTLDGLFG